MRFTLICMVGYYRRVRRWPVNAWRTRSLEDVLPVGSADASTDKQIVRAPSIAS